MSSSKGLNLPGALEDEHELDNFEDLASSQPIPLSQLCTKSSSKRGARGRRLLSEVSSGSESRETHPTRQQRVLSRLSALHQSSMGSSRLNLDTEPFTSSQLSSQGWGSGDESHYKQNPLSYSRSYNSSYSHSTPLHGSVTEDTSLHLYGANFDRTYNQSPYESLRIRTRPKRPATQITSGLQLSGPPIPPQPEPVMERVPVVRDLEKEEKRRKFKEEVTALLKSVANEIENPKPDEMPMKHQDASMQHPDKPRKYPATTMKHEDTVMKHQDTAFKHHGMTMKYKDTAFKHGMTMKHQGPDFKHPDTSLKHQDTVFKHHDMTPKHLDTAFKYDDMVMKQHDTAVKHNDMVMKFHDMSMGAKTHPMRKSQPWETKTLGGSIVSNRDHDFAAQTEKVLRTPPGLTRPKGQLQQREEDAEAWFHRDSRGEDHLRQQIAGIAGNCPSTKEEQTTQLLGDIILNLYGYVSKDGSKKAGNFNNFGDAPPSCYSPKKDNKPRSYFDW
ncbi:hypothetical protein BO70DRAFT_349550 [Aspergillus heteromorphus CBS 117.55]|uniref:Uncharacterized protein n=1 Tax=Aspergillus heteromorphus CBS 117.55 TaxID=1448321 RepID=A0A317X219_9EURO|nr:uncharacterized protein BO70DRAFT_349550 [Aspergillus heteromorphus CBS 117.55]PWY91038.1 hypothetical protein BO70DRAFT_349550 [Aspergillus heteromorphus CBS 117.55]